MLKDELFALVKSMSPSEKRLFKLKSANYNKSLKTNALFDIYAAADSLEDMEKRATRKLKTKRLGKLHSELYQSLQPFLVDLEIKADKRLQYYQKVFCARNLMRRGLRKQAYKMVDAVVKETLRFEMFEVAQEALALKQSLLNQVNDKQTAAKLMEEVLEEMRFVSERLSGIHNKFTVYRRLLTDYSLNGPARDSSKEAGYRWILEKKTSSDQGYRIGKMDILSASLASMMVQDQTESLRLKGELVELYERYDYISALNPRDYSVAYMNYTRELINNGDHATARRMIAKGNNLVQQYPEAVPHRIYYLGWSLILLIREGDIPQAVAIAGDMAPLIPEDGDGVYKNYISVKIVVAHLLADQYDQALDFINIILNLQIKTLRKDCYCVLLIYEIIIYIKMDWDELAEAKLAALNRYLKINYDKQAFEKWAIQFLRRLIKDGKPAFRQHAEQAFEDIGALGNDQLSQSILRLGEFDIWLGHELGNRGGNS